MSKTIRRLALVGVIAVTAFGVTTGVASATKPALGCPKAFSLVDVSTLTGDDAANAADVNRNGDTKVCIKDIAANGKNPGTNIVDNTSSQG